MTILKNILLNGRKADIYIDGGRIARICYARKKRPELEQGAEILDCTGCAAVPAFVNMHIHAAMSLIRGIGEDMVLTQWLDKIWEVESRMDEEFVYWGTKVACLEMIRTGTVTFNDHYWYSTAGHRAAVEMGMNPVVSYVVMDRENPVEAERQKAQFERMYEESLKWNSPHSFAAAFHSIYTVSEEMILWTAEFARRHGLRLHFHLSETQKEVNDCLARRGLTPVQYLDRLGVLDQNAIAAHTLWVSDEDIRILGERRVNCVHNINSNLKLASGYMFRYNELRDAGANLCIGTDGCASSNNLDLLEALKTAAIVQKAWRGDPEAMPLDELMNMATVNGARALGLETGEIKTGAHADLLIVDTDNSFFLSDAPFLANFIYSAHSDCIRSVMHNGRFLMRDRVIEGEREILERTRAVLRKFGKKK
ncbi:MAG: amidohydrolase [Bacteroidales bacterium]|nr:amidohydrolase [Bacteroidales bacterium]